MRREFFIVGPTASGKSELAVAVAEKIVAEIVNADAFQIYRGLDLLTAKPSRELQQRAKHHLLGVVPLTETMSAVKFRALALAALAEIQSRKKDALVVGGSGLYVKALTDGFDKTAPPNKELRRELSGLSISQLAARLQKLDPERSALTDLKNPRRVIRAIEISVIPSAAACHAVVSRRREGSRSESVKVTPRAPSTPKAFGTRDDGGGGARGVFLTRDRDDLYRRIDARVNEIFRSGVEEEVRQAEKIGATAANTLGLREIQELLAGKVSRAECVAKIQQATRRYAKRQLTWFRHQTNFPQLNLSTTSPADAASAILGMFAQE